MTKALGFVCTLVLMVHSVGVFARQAPASQSTATVTATIESIEKETRTVRLKRPDGTSVDVEAPDQMEGFNSLRVGDQVTATYNEMIVISLRKPGDPDTSAPSTTTQRKDRQPGSETRRQRTLIGSVDSIDQKMRSLTLKTSQGRLVVLPVADAKQLQGIKVGDSIGATYYESLLIKVERPRK